MISQIQAPCMRLALATLFSAATVMVPTACAAAADPGWLAAWQQPPIVMLAFGLLLVALAAMLIALWVAMRKHRRTHETNRRASGILHNSRAGTWEWNVQSGETRYDERWAEIVGYRLAELEPVSIDTWERLTHPDDLAESKRRLRHHFSGESDHYENEARMRHKDGHWVWVHDSGRVITRTPDGKPEWMLGIHLDVSERRGAEQEREDWMRRFAELSSSVPGVICQYRVRPDGSSHFPFASEGLWHIYGYRPEEVADDASPILETIHPDDRERIMRSIEASARTGQTWHETYRIEHPELGLRRVEGNATPSRRPDGSVVWHSYVRDITDLHRSLERVRTAASVFDASHEGIAITDADLGIRDVNPALQRMTGFSRDEVLGRTPESLLPDEAREDASRRMRSALHTRAQWSGELPIRRKNGETFPAAWYVCAVRDDEDRLSHYVALLSDLTLQKTQERHLGEIANLDPLTGAGNRRMAEERLQHAVSLARRNGTKFAACIMDLDEFKPVNDRYGHDAGDHVLKTIAERVQELVRSGDCLCRLGGDEFLLLLQEPQGEAVFERILDTIRIPIRLDIDIVRVSSSLGVALFDGENVTEPDDILQRADRALYAAKSAGRNGFRFDTDRGND